MLQKEPPTSCPKCEKRLIELKGFSEKTNRDYHFWTCIDKECSFTWNPSPKSELYHEEVMNGLREIYKRLEAIETFFLKKNDIQNS